MYHDVVPGSRANDDPALCPTVDLEIHEIVNCEEILRSYGLNVVCDHCGDEQESVTAIVTVRSEPPDRFTLCGLCYRKLCELALGEVC